CIFLCAYAANFNADAQFGIINAIDKAAKKNKAKKESANENAKMTLAIPQPGANGTIVFMVQKGLFLEGFCQYDPSKLELTMSSTLGGNTSGAVYKIDPATGKVTDKNRVSKGSMSADGTIESPNLGTIRLKAFIQRDGVNNVETISHYFTVKQLGYDPDKKYTVEELEDKIEWKNTSAENEVMEYESSRPYAGFDRDKFPHLKNCKVAAVGLMSDWKESKTTHTSGTDYAGTTWHKIIQYWVVYELTDGCNTVAFNYLDKYYGKEEGTKRGTKEWHDVSDWVRK
ncbi:MAG: hypothetical protein IKP73_07500, partial [Bacteroidales bacterium]|nr:hypothetical protein [Bacteroidales bacterium]